MQNDPQPSDEDGTFYWSLLCAYWNTTVDGVPFPQWLAGLHPDLRIALDIAADRIALS